MLQEFGGRVVQTCARVVHKSHFCKQSHFLATNLFLVAYSSS
jgi:hypothetical protein